MRGKNNRVIFWTVVFLLILAAVFLIIKAQMPPSDEGIKVPPLSEEDWVTGNLQSEIILIEYSDYQCPACAYYNEIVEDIVKEFGNHMQLAYRHFPLKSIHSNANLAVQAAESAGVQGKFWEMHNLLFTNQNEWSQATEQEAQELFIKYATDLDLKISQFIEDLKSSKIKNKVEESYKKAIDIGLNSTPSFFLNGEKIKNPSGPEEFEKIIRQALKEQEQNEQNQN